ncbi:hypothetical protein LMA04_06970 [Pseudescherichia vulneris]|uniref:hypothetical protein n=1 Tax=Pseudescherichia TaxID=2055880 RepID=UPI00227AE3E0|nr:MULTISPECIES: hypothetical protein [Pseudescherichia]WAH53771.1 hypothetical protein LMA04_06970 [Pseudescherichia vulneris]
MKHSILEVVTHAENAMSYNSQALAVLEMWMDSLSSGDDCEANRVAAVRSLVHEALSHLQKAAGVQK